MPKFGLMKLIERLIQNATLHNNKQPAMNENVPKPHSIIQKGIGSYSMCMDSCGGDEIILLFGRGLVFEQNILWYEYNMIPHQYIQQSTIEIEDVYCQYKGDVIAMKSLNEEKATLLFVNNEVYNEHMLFEITYIVLCLDVYLG